MISSKSDCKRWNTFLFPNPGRNKKEIKDNFECLLFYLLDKIAVEMKIYFSFPEVSKLFLETYSSCKVKDSYIINKKKNVKYSKVNCIRDLKQI